MNEEEFSAEYLRMKETCHEFFSAIMSYIIKSREEGLSLQDACLIPLILLKDMYSHIRVIELLKESEVK